MCHRSPGAQSASQLFPQRNQSWPTPHGEGSFDLCFNDIRSRFAFTRYFARSKNNRRRFMKCLTIKHKGWFHHSLMYLGVFSLNLDRQHRHTKVWGMYIITWTKYMVPFLGNNIDDMWQLAPFPNQAFWTRPTQCRRQLHGNLDKFLYFWQIVHKRNRNHLQQRRRRSRWAPLEAE